jgi:hypothetical protein
MVEDGATLVAEAPELFPESAPARALLDQLLADSRLYKQSHEYRGLLEFVVRFRQFAPFNAMLLQLQKPGLSYAASARDWLERFGRAPKEHARPLLILQPFGPVALVYDVLDTEGEDLPEEMSSFPASGDVTDAHMARFFQELAKCESLQPTWFDAGDHQAGQIQRFALADDESSYTIYVNRNHPAPVQFATLAHELAHLFLGHLGPDKRLKIKDRRGRSHAQVEIEAESVAFVVCKRNGVKPKSEKYLSHFVDEGSFPDIYQVMRAAGQVEAKLGLAAERGMKLV